ncbi:UDP-N-acetylmuramoyl-tripeptide--D-alanyl-D-alanine ligase [Bacillus sp. SG-1]|uniref:UDP-N-acetylmuramoyl-tripeptide--D-alanyl-D- alanine ligase n=1 Tax=Bacillus sp. SG-1 TaxID=161544 RepID=UPI0001544C61|nr:UDP-N-acetylmuramoyl-tripeptide--D-alanyl-D-alanine ligase [Bacillus sp. SG-1]EDL63242.1 UDP-N-acetylmuramoyl-tripeptide--D-alanyl-D-alanine ligase (UDP-N-acetylmuramoylalanyl-D-glutamyl-2 [Bacillus sp. SG-1]
MINKSLGELAKMIKVENDLSAFQDVAIGGVSIDSRKIEKGNLFIPFKGEKVDGHKFVEGAIKSGAAASLWEKDVPNPPEGLPIIIVENSLQALQNLATAYRHELGIKVVGITGSNGKTTTKDMVANLLSLKYKVQKTQGNFNSHIGLPLTILALEKGTEVAVLEMGMSGFGEIEQLSNIALPDAAIITNIGESHLQDLGSREGIATAKMEIISGLKEDGLFVYYGEEPLLKERIDKDWKFKVETFGKGTENTLYPLDVKTTDSGSVFKVNAEPDTEVMLPVLGEHNVMNALASMLVAKEFDVEYKEMPEAFQQLKLTQMRMEMMEGKRGEKILNDAYNASPTSMRAAIGLLSGLQGYGKKILVAGDMLELGPNEENYHYEVGQEVQKGKIDLVFTFGTLARQTARGAAENIGEKNVFSFDDKQELTEKLESILHGDEIILFKASRGMKLEEIIESLTE